MLQQRWYKVVSTLCNVVLTLFQRLALTLYQRCATLKVQRGILFHFQRQINFILMLIHDVETTLIRRGNIGWVSKLDMVGSRLVSDVLIFSGDILVDIQLLTFLLLSKVSELSIGAKTKFWQPALSVKDIQPNKKSNAFSDICATFFCRSVSFFSASTCLF